MKKKNEFDFKRNSNRINFFYKIQFNIIDTYINCEKIKVK